MILQQFIGVKVRQIRKRVSEIDASEAKISENSMLPVTYRCFW